MLVRVFLTFNGPTGKNFRSARELFQWIGLGNNMPRYFHFHLEFLKGVQSVQALNAKIYLITNGLRGRQVLLFPEL